MWVISELSLGRAPPLCSPSQNIYTAIDLWLWLYALYRWRDSIFIQSFCPWTPFWCIGCAPMMSVRWYPDRLCAYDVCPLVPRCQHAQRLSAVVHRLNTFLFNVSILVFFHYLCHLLCFLKAKLLCRIFLFSLHIIQAPIKGSIPWLCKPQPGPLPLIPLPSQCRCSRINAPVSQQEPNF